MIYTIENDAIRVQVSSVGAELMSLQTKSDGHEYLWQGDATYWASRASNLFPICGRLTDGKYTYRGKTYEMLLHGFARHAEMTVVSQQPDAIAFRLTDSADSLQKYPFHFELTISYQLEGQTVRQTFTVRNTGDEVLPFAVGGHPGFNVPMEDGTQFEDYYVEFDCVKPAKSLVMSETCYDTGDRVPFALENGKVLHLNHHLFDHDAIFLTDMCKAVTLKSDKTSRSVHLSYPDMNFLGFWHKPNTEAPYVCIEPWYSVPALDGIVDDMETKRMMIHLAPNAPAYTNTIEITIH